jgi:hypothetical protein
VNAPILSGSAVLLLGAIHYVLQFVRDWSHIRRIGAAEAQRAEVAAQRAAIHADFSQWLVDEAKIGSLHMSLSELIDVVTRPEIQASTSCRTGSDFNYPKKRTRPRKKMTRTRN